MKKKRKAPRSIRLPDALEVLVDKKVADKKIAFNKHVITLLENDLTTYEEVNDKLKG